MEDTFIFPLNGLASGKTEVSRHAGKKFFNSFGNSEIIDADLDADIAIFKSGQDIHVDMVIEGNVTVLCDRCLEELVLPVDAKASLDVKFGREPAVQDEIDDGGREMIFLSDTDADLDLSQVAYDYVCLSLPMQKVHEDGKCNPAVTKFLSSPDGQEPYSDLAEDAGNPFAKLKDFLKDKQ
jgi:uncharacterized metal-binding protein YceD (DUF177 family)